MTTFKKSLSLQSKTNKKMKPLQTRMPQTTKMLINARRGLDLVPEIVITIHAPMIIGLQDVRVADATIATTPPTGITHRVTTRTSTIIVSTVAIATTAASPAERRNSLSHHQNTLIQRRSALRRKGKQVKVMKGNQVNCDKKPKNLTKMR